MGCGQDARAPRLLDLELKQSVTRWQIHVVTFAWIPTADNQSPGIRIRFDFINQARDLIDAVMFGIVPAEGSPKISIDRAEVAGFTAKATRVFFVGPLFPNVHTAGAQVRFVRIAR